ncbi:unnamed protein product [Thlaspi arvense]|uniref:F-box/kelch-repeat protein n=1 Tax=Thlaspi arvense TaxID=13288 RepID=A0AAU9SCT3_THLAR|nr:unnamed protein product [Thlaspi arvense]
MVEMVNESLAECSQRKRRGKVKRKRMSDNVDCVCVVENVLYAFFRSSGLMWFDTKINAWRSLEGAKVQYLFPVDAMAEYDGKLAVFGLSSSAMERYTSSSVMERYTYTYTNNNVQCVLIALHRVGEMIRGTIEWSGAVATVPRLFALLHCLVASH